MTPDPTSAGVAYELDLSWLPSSPRHTSTIDWTAVDPTGLGYVAGLSGIVRFNHRLVMTGATGDPDGDAQQAIWTSIDGHNWTPSNIEATDLRGSVTAPVVGGPGLVASSRVAGVLVSADGRTWHQVADDDLKDWVINDVFRTPSGFVAFGYKWPETTAPNAIWISPNGVEWEPVHETDAEHVAAGLIEAVFLGDNITAFVSDADPYWRPNTIEVWRSVDGATWAHVSDLPESAEAAGVTVARSGARLVAVSLRSEFLGSEIDEALAWTSEDGIEWSKTGSAPWNLYDLIPAGSGFVAAGGRFPKEGTGIQYEDAVRGETWLSRDGSEWRRVKQPGSSREINVIVEAGDYLLGLGMDFNRRPTGAEWIAPIPDLGR